MQGTHSSLVVIRFTLPASHKQMKITLNTPLKNITDLIQSFEIPFELSASNNNEDFQIEIPDEIGSGTIWFREIMNGMGLLIVKNLGFKEEFEIVYNHDKTLSAYALIFFKKLGGVVNLFSEKENRDISIHKGGYLISSAIHETHKFAPGKTTDLVSIFIFPEFIERHLKTLINYQNRESNTNHIEELLMQTDTLSPEILIGINAMENNRFTGTLKHIYLESKVLEIIALFFKDFEEKDSNRNMLTKKEYEQILHAQKILKENMENPPGIIKLAHLVGLNEYKLRLGFKELFDNTIYGYLRRQRMIRAKELIENNELSVSEAGYMVGYSNMSHFAGAFKNEFGISPSKLKK